MNTTVAAVVVTYNRLTLLKECVEALRNQTLQPDAIIIVNNGSKEDTTFWLESQKDLLVFHQENLGGAGGFQRGMKEAYALGYDWIWIMDDDAFPQASCLEKLTVSAAAQQATVVAPIVMENGQYCAFHRGWINRQKVRFPQVQEPVPYEKVKNTGSIGVDFISFVGLMLHRSVIEQVGFPEADYYIFNDDVEYSLRIKKAGIDLYLLPGAVIHHKVNYAGKEFDMATVVEAPVLSGPESRFQKFKNRKTLYYDVNLFMCYLRRNALINIGTYFDMSKSSILYLCLTDFIKSFVRTGFSKGAFSKYRLLLESYRQGISRKIDNKAMIKLAGQI